MVQDQATLEAIRRLYKKQWKSEDYDSGASTDEKLEFLQNKGFKEEVEAYYWNQYLREWLDSRDSTKKAYNRRAAIEAFHGHMKQQMLLEKFMDAGALKGRGGTP